MMFRTLAATALAAALAVPLSAAPVHAADGWHPVQEGWEPYPEGELFLPAERYCGDFDVRSTPTYSDVSARVLSRWDSGEPRDTAFSGPLVVDATNTSTGESVELDLSGYGESRQRRDGSLTRFESLGPAGFGWPVGSRDLDPGYYVLEGRHVVRFTTSGSRRLAVDEGRETDVCALLR